MKFRWTSSQEYDHPAPHRKGLKAAIRLNFNGIYGMVSPDGAWVNLPQDWAAAAHVREVRAELGISQERMAEMLGVCVRALIRWEHGEVMPSRMAQNQIKKLAD